MLVFVVAITLLGSVLGGDHHHHNHDNHCEPLEDYGPLERKTDTRRCCTQRLKDNCVWQEERQCMNVTDLKCEVKLFTECKMDMEDVELNECHPDTTNKTLKSCEKITRPEVHTKNVYECKPVTKQHCTTVWEVDENGQKVWTGNNDCKEVTWEECNEVPKDVTFMVPTMNCTDEIHPYMDYISKPRTAPARKTECEVKKEQVCLPSTELKCGTIRFKVCKEEKEEDDCSDYDVIIPHKKKLHLKWCLLDDGVTDFTKEVAETEGGGEPEDPAEEVTETAGGDEPEDPVEEVTETAGGNEPEDPVEESTDKSTEVSGKSDKLPRSKATNSPIQKFPFGLNLRNANLVENGRLRRHGDNINNRGLANQVFLHTSSYPRH